MYEDILQLVAIAAQKRNLKEWKAFPIQKLLRQLLYTNHGTDRHQ